MPPKKADGAAAPKPKPTHGSYQDMITDAIITLKDRNGSSRHKLKKYVKANNQINVTSDAMFDSLFNKALKAGVEKGIFEQPKGPSGGTKLAKKAKADVAKKEAKKEAAPKKKVAPKKKEPEKKKPAPKKAAAPKKKVEESEKKAAPKKVAAPKEKKAPVAKKEKKEVEKDPLKKTKGGRVTKTATAAKPVAKKAAPAKKAAAPKKEKKAEAA